MLHEKPGEIFHWKNKLDELDNLPSEPLMGKMAAWEKLHTRLRHKPRVRKTTWYWTAAACVLISAGLAWFYTSERVSNAATGKNQYQTVKSVNDTAMVNKATVRVDTPRTTFTTRNTQQPHTVLKHKKNQVFINDVVIGKPDLPYRNIPMESLPENVVDTNTPPDTLQAELTKAIPARKKLRVIHINELGKGMEQELQYVKTASPTVIQGKYLKDDLPAFSLGKNASDNFIKIKLSPSN